MKIGAISDLHIKDEESSYFLEQISDVCSKKEIDLLLIAGDISEDARLTIDYVQRLNKKVKTLYVPGNHDLWNKGNKMSTKEIYELFKRDQNCLLNKSYELTAELEIIGHIGWYDYSLGDEEQYSTLEFDSMVIDDRMWKDKKYVSWTGNNQFVCNTIDSEIETLINSNDKQKILVTHMISNPGFKVLFDESRSNKGFFNGFLGSDKLYRLTGNDLVTHAICGHVHYRKTIIENQTEYICMCLGNESEWSKYLKSPSLREQLKQCMYTFEI